MSRPFKYGFFGEDEAQKTFLTNYLITVYPNRFVEEENFGWQIQATNKREVDNNVAIALWQGIAKFGLDVLFIGRDTDSIEKATIQKVKTHLKDACKGDQKAILMIPVQCIEHWFWYLKWRRTNPHSTKNESLESFTRTQAKREIYGDKHNSDRRLQSARELLSGLDIVWLESRSESFRDFHQQVVTFLAKY
ncbi:hypothetical protein [Larkinella terrae]|uniref:DUF4276 family protein n=1 Tax=Larkinella terrae TaxID=2025311 RepID=A0A7K0ERK9_9BACT|nr:hypothetical protein [Larkinella terrae]MRS64409.1 hypothetical protein [Larkinella terrae]